MVEYYAKLTEGISVTCYLKKGVRVQFQNPYGALAFLLIPAFILLYLLKRRYREEKVPSTFLWRKAASQWEASHPWQKWRKSLLFFLQLLALCALIFAFMQPAFRSPGLGQNSIVVLDVSLSMRAEEDGKSRLAKAKEEVLRLIDQMQPGEEMSLILTGHRNEILVADSSDKGELRGLLQNVSAQYGGSGVFEALQLAKSLEKDEESAAITLFTDKSIEQIPENVRVRNVAKGAPNLAVGAVSYTRNSEDRTLSVLGLIENHAGADTTAVELWRDGELVDIQDVEFKGENRANVIFDGVDPEAQRLMLALSTADALEADNYAYCAVQDHGNYKILLQTERNVFLEKAILLRDDMELYKSTPEEELPFDDYDLIIGDGTATEILPDNKNLWLIAPKAENDWISLFDMEPQGLKTASTALAEMLFQHVDLNSVAFARLQGIEAKDPASHPLVYNGAEPLILASDEGPAKRLAFGFDLHNSNLPMTKDFPILVQNILEWFLPAKGGQTGMATVYEAVPVALGADSVSYSVELPDGRVVQDQTALQFTGTDEPGFYGLSQRDNEGEAVLQTEFAVNVLTGGAAESDLYTAAMTDSAEAQEAQGNFSRLSLLLPFIAILALLLMLVEWVVYHRGT